MCAFIYQHIQCFRQALSKEHYASELFTYLRSFLFFIICVSVTGKLWPKLYEIKLHPAKKQIKSGVIEQLCLRMPAHFAKP